MSTPGIVNDVGQPKVKHCDLTAVDRNKHPILEVIRQVIPEYEIQILEIASGSGEHMEYFSGHLDSVTWQPSECDESSVAWLVYVDSPDGDTDMQIKDPVVIDASEDPVKWALGRIHRASYDFVLCINMLHICMWSAVEGLFRGVNYYLKPGGALILYGPFKVHGNYFHKNNIQFDENLKRHNVNWGLRDSDDLDILADTNGLYMEKMIDMPSNNKSIIYRRKT